MRRPEPQRTRDRVGLGVEEIATNSVLGKQAGEQLSGDTSRFRGFRNVALASSQNLLDIGSLEVVTGEPACLR